LQTRIGLGYDVHRLVPGRALYLGGVRIPHPRGLAGHSDGDALIHAVIDAILGATGQGDIGRHFPDDDPRTENIRSPLLLKKVMAGLAQKKLKVISLDSVIVAEKPRLASYVDAMKDILSPLLHIRRERLGIKAKTNEGLGLIGGQKAIACWAVVLVGKK